jgi:predicted branched-subunit amino acid permease
MEAYQEHTRREAHLRFLGGALVLYAGWQLATALGAVAGSGLPASWQLEFIGPVYMVALVVRQARTATLRISALVAVAVAAVTVLGLPPLASTAGMVAGLAIGSLLLRRSR